MTAEASSQSACQPWYKRADWKVLFYLTGFAFYGASCSAFYCEACNELLECKMCDSIKGNQLPMWSSCTWHNFER